MTLVSWRETDRAERTAAALFVIAQILLIVLLIKTGDAAHLGRSVRDIFKWVILATAVYKWLIFLSLIVTGNKDKLDIAWNWQQAVAATLFSYAFISILIGPGIARSYFWNIAWYQIWVQLALSCGLVLYYVITLRILPILRVCRMDGAFCGWKNLWFLLRGDYDAGSP